MEPKPRNRSVFKGLIAGSLGGLAASWVMTQFQSLLTPPSAQEKKGDDATVKTADKISSSVLDHKLTEDEKKTAGPVVHYAYGTAIGALYGGLAQRYEITKYGFGSAYGTGAWLFGDEVAVPALGLGNKPAETPGSQHVQALAAHLVYGVALEGFRRLALKVI